MDLFVKGPGGYLVLQGWTWKFPGGSGGMGGSGGSNIKDGYSRICQGTVGT